jgi:hypothetical protein
MAEVGREEGTVGAQERETIHSLFDLGDTLVREVMVPAGHRRGPRDVHAPGGPRSHARKRALEDPRVSG